MRQETYDFLFQLGFTFIRVSIGFIMSVHGFQKLMGGTNTWLFLGDQLSPFGITFMPALWGYLAAMAEFLGGIALMIGFGIRVAAFFIACVMIVALTFHLRSNDPYKAYSPALTILCIAIGLMLTGSGKYSLDYWIHQKLGK